jgi:flagellar assembly protein FliH
MQNAIKFTFDTDFDGRDTGAPARAGARRVSYSADEIEALRHEASAQGRQAGEIVAQQAATAAITELTRTVRQAFQEIDADMETLRGEAAALAWSMARKLAGAALAQAPEAEVEETLRTALHHAIGEPRLALKTAPDMCEHMRAHAPEIAAETAFEGRLQISADPALSGADCRVEWHGGGLERSLAALETQLSDIVARRFPRARANKE